MTTGLIKNSLNLPLHIQWVFDAVVSCPTLLHAIMSRQRTTEDHVRVLKYVKVAQKWRFALVAKQSGLIVLDHVLINGRDEYHPEGRYYVEWYERSRRRRCTIPTSANIEQAARQKLMEIRTASTQSQRLTIGAAVEHYLSFIELHRGHGTWLAYRNGLTMFQDCYGKPYIDQVQRQDLLHFMSCCYKRGLSSRTVYGKLATVLQFFRMYGKRCLVQPGDWPKYVEAIRPIYEPEEIDALFRYAEDQHRILFMFLLASGFRDREFQCLWWRDIDFRNCIARVTAKPSLQFNPKSWEERAVPLPRVLIEQLWHLKQSRNAAPTHLAFPNSQGGRLRQGSAMLKSIAERAGLNCGQCVTKFGNKCAEGPHCTNFFLHKFRHTFATEHLRDGVDICTLQRWMGHRDIQSTMTYLRGLVTQQAVAKVSTGWLSAHMVLT